MIHKTLFKDKEQKKHRQNFLIFRNYFFSLSALIWAIFIILIFGEKNKILLSVFQHLLSPWHIWINNCPIMDIAVGMAIFLLYWLVGYYFLRCFDVYFPALVEYALALPLGITILTIPYTIIAISGVLYPLTILIIYAIALSLIVLVAYYHQRSPIPEAGNRIEPKFFRDGYRLFARREYQLSIQKPTTLGGKAIYYIATTMLGILIVLNFQHSLLYPETYWDSLIYYLGYGRMTYLQHKFPVKVVAQVGLGLGANYPHLFNLMGAVMATLTGKWSNIYPQLIAPICGLISTLLVYHLILRLTRRALIGILATLLFRCVPLGIAYFTYASDYAVAIMFTAVFLYLAMHYIETRMWSYLCISAVICAGAVQINYLMWYLWLGWGLMILLSQWHSIRADKKIFQPSRLDLTQNLNPPGLLELIGSRKFLILLAITLMLSLIWYIRNIIVTGNPIYAFFPQIFNGKNINLEVLASCFNEWRLNGDGIGKFGTTLWEKIRASWIFFVTWEHSWKLAPIFVAFGVPGFLIAIMQLLGIMNLFPGEERIPFNRFLILVVYIFSFLLIYHYCISDIYLYHIVPIIVPIAIFSAVWLALLWTTKLKLLAVVLCLYVGLSPGIAMSLMGFKFKKIAEFGGQRVSPLQLVALRNPCMPEKMFYRLEFGADVEMWEYINQNLKGKRILSHENRHLVYDPSITFIHLDDWEIQQLYSLPDDEKLRQLKKMQIQYYLYIPMEDKHPIVKRLNIDRWREDPEIMKLIYKSGENKLYQFNFSSD
ncbi:MAG: glycosyltransferase family 39 protein [Candidatus Sumerlaeia bacterium]|nr:glycosyltransferase family 39 protein [Candidatus Sumerlaeia bacterium]